METLPDEPTLRPEFANRRLDLEWSYQILMCSRSETPMDPEKNKALLRLLRLMTEPEKEDFRADFSIAQGVSDDELMERLESLPRYEAVRAFLRAADATLIILKEVFEILQSFGIATKTTGCVFVLANPANPAEQTELVFAQQTVGAVCSWSPTKKWNKISDSLADMRSRWIRLQPILRSLLRRAEPKHRRGEIDLIESAMQRRAIYEPDRHHVDSDAQWVLHHFAVRIHQMVERLEEIPKSTRPPELTSILQGVRPLAQEVDGCLSDPQERHRSPRRYSITKPPTQSTIARYTSSRFAEDLDTFLEDLYSLSDLVRGEDIVDMLQIDLWTARPQLFEIWVLLTLLRWIRRRGHSVEFLRTDERGRDAPFRWNLSYAKDSTPCAIVRDPKSVEQFVFFQLYRPSGDMPDISLLEGADPSSGAIWSVDPKHSEKQAYSLSDYGKTATRYRDSFGAELSLIVEYFARPELGPANPMQFGDRAKLIRDCRPNGKGLPILFSELAKFHPALAQVLICIDFSDSFSAKRETALEELRQRVESDGRTFARECICFAGDASIIREPDLWKSSEWSSTMSSLRPGTVFEPLLRAIVDAKQIVNISEIVLVTDGDFDVPLESVIQRIGNELKVRVSVFDSS